MRSTRWLKLDDANFGEYRVGAPENVAVYPTRPDKFHFYPAALMAQFRWKMLGADE